jgi:hypothetical protein
VISVSPANAASTTLAAKLGFEKIGGHVDEADGYEDIYLLEGESLRQALAPQQSSQPERSP